MDDDIAMELFIQAMQMAQAEPTQSPLVLWHNGCELSPSTVSGSL